MSHQQTLDATDFLELLSRPEVRSDPYPVLHRLREQDPVHRTSAGFYLLTRHADVLWAMRRTGKVFRGPSAEDIRAQFPDVARHRSRALFLNSLSMKNPPEHTRLRALLSRDFTPTRVAGLTGRISEITEQLLDAIEEPLRDKEIVDIHSALSVPLGTRVFAELLGVPDAERDHLAELVTGIYPATMPLPQQAVLSRDRMLDEADACSAQLEEYLLALFARRRRNPQDDLISDLVSRHHNDPDQLSDLDLISMVWILWVTGVETSGGGLDQGVRAMLNHPGELRWLRGGPDSAQAFGEEALRCYGSSLFAGIVRIATEDVELPTGHLIPAGSDVRPSTAAANRDPAVFPDPDRFDPARDQRATISFGAGMHYCPGTAMSRLTLRIALSALHTRFPDLVAAGDPVWHDRVSTRLLHALPVAVDGASPQGIVGRCGRGNSGGQRAGQGVEGRAAS